MGKKTRFAPRFSSHKLDAQRRLLAELPERQEQHVQRIHSRNQMLAATQAYNLRLERNRVQQHITSMPASLQKMAAEQYVGNLERRIHHLAHTGLP